MTWERAFAGRQYRARFYLGSTIYLVRQVRPTPQPGDANWVLLIPGEEPIEMNYGTDEAAIREALAGAERILQSKINTYFRDWQPSEIEIE